MATILTAEQAKNFAHLVGISAQMAQAANCMVQVNLDKLQAYPMSDEFHAVIEIAGPDDVDFADYTSQTGPRTGKSAA